MLLFLKINYFIVFFYSNQIIFVFRFRWERVSSLLGTSDVDTYWNIPEDTEIGTFRICHFGHNRQLLGSIFPYEGCTRTFTVVAN